MARTVFLDLVAQTRDALQLRLWRENQNVPRTRTLALPEIADLLRLAETDYYSPLPARLVETGRRLFQWLDGGERWRSEEIASAANQTEVLVLAIAPDELAHLPWEVLHDGTGFLVHALNPPVLPVRWRRGENGARPPANRPLQTLFMASSPENTQPVLNYEGEESVILEATARRPLDLTVEESGCLEELGELVRDYGAGFFDVLHLTGHADHDAQGRPIFILEDSEGRRLDATADDIARALPHRPPLVFLSGCRTGQNPAHGQVRSLAERLLEAGFPAVLGWGRPVRDAEATLAARHLYSALAAGESLPLALARTQAELWRENARDWHLLRCFCAGQPPGAFVTPSKTKDRKLILHRPAESEFLDPLTQKVKVAARASFVGRRRLLQRSVRRLRQPEAPPLGLLLRGQGGRGKSSVAARLCDRLRRDFQRVVVIGRLDEVALVNAWAPELPDDAHRAALRDPAADLRFRLERTLRSLAEAGRLPPLFVLDDFEQNQPGEKQGDLALAPHAAAALGALFAALKHTGFGRVLLTCRYALPAPFAASLLEDDVPPLDANEEAKKNLLLGKDAPVQVQDAQLLAQARAAADGNPRLMEWLHQVLAQPGLDHRGIMEKMRAAEEEFRENILARALIASLPEESRALLGRMLLLEEPVPFEAVQALDPAFPSGALPQALVDAAALSLVDHTREDGQPHYRVPHQLGGGDPPLLPIPEDAERAAQAGRVLEVLYRIWWEEAAGTSESRMLELIRLAADGGRKKELVALADRLTTGWLNQNRYREARALLESVLEPTHRHHSLLLNLAWAVEPLGDGDLAGELLQEAANACPPEAGEERAPILFHYASWLMGRGQLDEVLRISRDELHPLYKELGRDREGAIVLGQIADVLAARGELEEALRIRREEELPVYERLGDVRSRAVTLRNIADIQIARGNLDEGISLLNDAVKLITPLGAIRDIAVFRGIIANVLAARGELEEALRIRREEQLPVYERLGDVRSRAVTLGKIADVLAARGELEEALRIRREELLPVFERLGDVRERAVTLGKIADILEAKGDIEEVFRVRREDEMPVYERLGDVQSLVVTRVQIAMLLFKRQRQDDLPEALGHLAWAYREAKQRGYKEAGQIAGLLKQLGVPIPE